MNATAPRFRLLGICDDVTACDCCGKQELKCTMALEELDADGNAVGEVYYGRDCGARALGWKVSADRAERLVRGTARINWDACWRAVQSSELAAGPRGRELRPVPVVVDGATIEVWDTFYGRLPAGKWTRLGDTRMHWRITA